MKRVSGRLLIAAMGLACAMSSSVAVANDQLAASMCDYVAADDKNRLRKILSDNRIRLRNVYDGVVCDGGNLIRHALKNNATDVGEFIVKQLPGSAVHESGDINWAESNGYGTAPLLEALKHRAGEDS